MSTFKKVQIFKISMTQVTYVYLKENFNHSKKFKRSSTYSERIHFIIISLQNHFIGDRYLNMSIDKKYLKLMFL